MTMMMMMMMDDDDDDEDDDDLFLNNATSDFPLSALQLYILII